MNQRHTGRAALLLAGTLFCGALCAGSEPQAYLRGPKEGEAFLAQAFAGGLPIDASGVERKWLDLPYAVGSPAEKLDIYLPNRGYGPFSVIVAIHGGSFNRGDKRDFQIAPMLKAVDHGYAVVAINYRLTQEAVFPAQVQDVEAALQWLRSHAGTYHLDAGRLAVWGDSAGGYLSAFAGVTDGRIRAVVDWYGPVDFARMTRIKRMEGVGIRLFGRSLDEAPGLYAEANPGTHLNRKAPPILIQHGDRDSLIPYDQSTEFAKAYRKAAGDAKVTVELFPGADHLDEQFTTVRNVDRVLRFLDEHVKEDPQPFLDPLAGGQL